MRRLDPGGVVMVLRLSIVGAAVAALGLAAASCSSAPEQAPDPTPTPTPTAVVEQASSEPAATPAPSSPPAASAPASEPAATTTEAGAAARPATTTRAATTTETLVVTRIPTTTRAATTTPAAPPLDDCFGGALSDDPMHCYLLEQAEARGFIDIVGLYEGGGRLYVSIGEAELTEELFLFMFQQSFAFYDKWPELLPEEKYGRFMGTPCDTFPNCYLTLPPIHDLDPEHILPPSSAYGRVLLALGGESGRRDVPGWASWRQVWPRSAAGAAAASAGFDVSDVDVTNFPEIDVHVCAYGTTSDGCDLWLKVPGAGVAGAHGGGGTMYYQIKNPPTDAAELKSLKDRLWPCHDVLGRCTFTNDEGQRVRRYTNSTSTVEIIPVEWDFRDLWRWKTILERFAVSAGNTIGIVDARVHWNQQRRGGGVLYPNLFLNGLSSANDSPADRRETIEVWTRGDQQVVADALPTLLPRLGIPVDAVGMVRRRY